MCIYCRAYSLEKSHFINRISFNNYNHDHYYDLETEDGLKVIDMMDIEYEDTRGNTILFYACCTNNVKLLKKLIEKGVNINHKNDTGETALIFMSYNEYIDIEIVEMLIKAGIDINHVSDDEETSIMVICRCEGYDNRDNILNVVKTLIKGNSNHYYDYYNSYRDSALTSACQNNNVELVEVLLESQEYINCDIALIYACEDNNVEIARLLINKGADPEYLTRSNDSPLLITCVNGYTEIFEMLINAGADVNYIDYDCVYTNNLDNSLLMYVCGECYKANERIVRLLIDKGADINYENEIGDTALIYTCRKKYVEIVKILIDGGADVNYINKNNDTVLTFACASGKIEIVEILLAKGANINHKINYNTLFIISYHKNNLNILKLLTVFGYNYLELHKHSRIKSSLDVTYYTVYEHLNIYNQYSDTESIDEYNSM